MKKILAFVLCSLITMTLIYLLLVFYNDSFNTLCFTKPSKIFSIMCFVLAELFIAFLIDDIIN